MADDPLSFDVANLDGLAKIKAEQQSLRDLAARAADHRDKVTEVYNRVVRDYEGRIRGLDEQAQRLRLQVREDFTKLDARYAETRQALDQARFDLQESEFRKEIGEYSAEEFQRRQQAIDARIAEKQRDLERIEQLRGRFLALLPADPPAAPATAPAAPSPAVVPLPTPQQITKSGSFAVGPAVAAAVAASAAAAAQATSPVPASPSIGETMVLPPPVTAEFRMPAPPSSAPGIGETMVLPPPGAAGAPTAGSGGETMVVGPPGTKDFKMPGAGSPGEGATMVLNPPGAAEVPEAFATIAVPAGAFVEERAGQAPVTHRLGMVTTIGRTPDNQIVIPSREVSRKHAEVLLGEKGYVLRDLGSPNGTFVNGKKVTEHALQEGDRITVAGQLFVFKAR